MLKIRKVVLIFLSFLMFSGCSNFSQYKKNNNVNFYIVRHGKTIFNTIGRVQGWADTPLTKEGRNIVKDLGKGLKKIKFSYVYSSDLNRTKETANVILKEINQNNLKVIQSKKLREHCLGEFEGDFDEYMWGIVARKFGYRNREHLMKNFDKVGFERAISTIILNDKSGTAESIEKVRKRMICELNNIANKVQKKGGGNVLIVSHGLSICSMLGGLTNKKITLLPNSSVTLVSYNNKKKFDVKKIGSIEYLKKDIKIKKRG